MVGRKMVMQTVNIKLSTMHNDSSSMNELTMAKKEHINNEARESMANGINAYVTRIDISALTRRRAGISDISVIIATITEATTSDVCRRVSFDNMSP